MKKTMFTVVLLLAVFATLFGQEQTKTEAVAAKFTEGDFYAYQFEQYRSGQISVLARLKSSVQPVQSESPPRTRLPTKGNRGSEDSGPFVLANTGGSKSNTGGSKSNPTTTTRRYGEWLYRPSWVSDTMPSEQDIDRAIAAYEEALKLEPSGTWKVPKKEYKESLLPPEGGVKARLADAQRRKQQWQNVEGPQLKRDIAALEEGQRQAQQAQQNAVLAQQQVESQPRRDDDFEIHQNSDNTITITKFKLSGPFTQVVIPEKIYGLPVTVIGNRAFQGIKIRSVVIPDSVKIIGDPLNPDHTFGGCELSSVTIGNSVTTIVGSAFLGNQLTSLTIPNSVTSIGKDAFRDNQLSSVTLGNSVTTIGEEAFRGNRLTSVTIPNSVTTIEKGAFRNNQLTSVTIPAGVKIEAYAFINNRLTSVTLSAGITHRPSWSDGEIFTNNPITNITIPAGISHSDIKKYGFEDSFINFYLSQNYAAGTYTKNGPIWARSTAGGID